MRFTELKIGDCFSFEGLEYTKTSPILACDTHGKSRIIPRSADLQPHHTHNTPAIPGKDSKLDQLYHAVTAILHQEVQDSDLEVKLRHAVEQAWKAIKGINNPPHQ